MRDNATKYARTLTLFADSHAQDAAQLAAGLESNDFTALKKLAHTLKGSAGMIGATAVSEAAAILDSAIRTSAGQEEIDAACTVLITQLASLLESVRGALSEE